MSITFFASAGEFRRWLVENHVSARELWLGFHKKASGLGGLSYLEAVDEALCFGWIDGIVRRVDEHSFTHRFTPRRPGSKWSQVNVRRVQRLLRTGRMRAAGRRAFSARRRGHYSYEQPGRPRSPADLPRGLAAIFRTDAAAWAHWRAQPPGYRRVMIRWVTSAKRPTTCRSRLDELVAASAAGRRLFGK